MPDNLNLQEGDVCLFQTVDDGEILFEDGLVAMSPNFSTAFYLSLFGGNVDDDGTPDNPKQWWANLNETEPARKYVSRTQNILVSLPQTSNNLKLLYEAVLADLEIFTQLGIVNTLSVLIAVPSRNAVCIKIEGTADSGDFNISFEKNWQAALT